jgi:hypothetical protein
MTTIDRVRFSTGLTYQGFKDQMTRNRDRVDAGVVGHAGAKARLADLLHGFAERQQPRHVPRADEPGKRRPDALLPRQ